MQQIGENLLWILPYNRGENMNKIKKFILPEHHNKLYNSEAGSSMALTREVADKINELVNAYNEFSEIDLNWKQEQEGRIRKGVLYMKDNLLNTMNDLMELLRDSGFIDDRIEYHSKHLKDRLDNFLNENTGVSTDGAEILNEIYKYECIYSCV